MKVIFLDFDGVINDWNTFNEINQNNVLILKKIIEETGAQIVCTSSTKNEFQRKIDKVEYEKSICYNRYVKVLNTYGINIYDFTDYIDGDREKEILDYLEKHQNIREFLILDDDYVMESLKPHQVYLDLYRGILEEHIEPSINILNGILGFYPPTYIKETEEEKYIRINEYYRGKSK